MNFKLGKLNVGDGYKSLIVAEMSGNHGGSYSRAVKILYAAKKAGADAIKLQTYTADTITLKSSNRDFLIPKNSPWHKHKNLWNLYGSAYTPWKWHKKLFIKARKIGLEIFSSPFDESAVDFLQSLNCCAYKIASSEINHIPLLEKVAKTKKPVILSTGVASEHDVNLAINILRKKNVKNIILLLCMSKYPADISDLNLKMINEFKKQYKVIVGLSDHTLGSTAATASVALGASVIEKHFSLQDKKKTVDSFFSIKEESFKSMVLKIRQVEKALKKNFPKLRSNKVAMRSIYISKNVNKGTKLNLQNIKIVRPGYSLHPKYFNKIIGCKVNKFLKKGERIKLSYLYNFKKH